MIRVICRFRLGFSSPRNEFYSRILVTIRDPLFSGTKDFSFRSK
ncbi:MAG: hypothetical protein [Olavius algarvensis Gamma 1 endosymbiont]|nr:MAG: hypothetical protein [Olavius algarvensis Gamma 1 endosymbiont]